MSQENVELIQRAYEDWNTGQTDQIPRSIHPECIHETSGAFPGFERAYLGHEGWVRFRATMFEAWEDFRIEPLEITAREDFVIAHVRFHGKGRVSGAEVVFEFHHVFHLRDGQVDRLFSRPNRAQALEAAGLSE